MAFDRPLPLTPRTVLALSLLGVVVIALGVALSVPLRSLFVDAFGWRDEPIGLALLALFAGAGAALLRRPA